MKTYYRVCIVLFIIATIAAWIFASNGMSDDIPQQSNEEDVTELHTVPTAEYIEVIEVEEPVIEKKYSFSEEDRYLLAKIAMAEAEGEDIDGKAYVMMVVLNRTYDDEFPDTIHDVIYQKIPNSKYHQFSPIDNGRFDRVEPSDECWEALNMVEYGWDKSEGALYFESCPNPDNWHSRNLQYLFIHCCHRFYK